MISRRTFLEAAPGVTVASRLIPQARAPRSSKFTPIDLAAHATDAYQARALERRGFSPAALAGVSELPEGEQRMAGIPFRLPPAGAARRLLVLGRGPARASVPLGAACRYVCVLHFCDRHPDDTDGPFGEENPRSEFEPVGLDVARYRLSFADGTSHSWPIRRRYEINPPGNDASHVPAAALPSYDPPYLALDDPLPSSLAWADAQTAVSHERAAVLWVCALENPHPDRTVRALEIEAAGDGLFAVCGVTLYHREEHPLRRLPLRRFEIALRQPAADWRKRYSVSVDLGVVARVYPAQEFRGAEWLASRFPGLGEPAAGPVAPARLIAEIAAGAASTLTIEDRSTGARWEYDLREAPDAARACVLEPRPLPVQCRVVDGATGRPVAARVAFRGASGRYIAPYGHPEDINTGWMQNIGPDVRIGGASYAYVDGTCRVDLPSGDFFVEASKGFEYRPVRRKVDVPASGELVVELERAFDRSRDGWVTADTHVHIGAPGLLVLEGAAEGLDLVNLLAAQWGRHFTNFADPPGRFAGSTAETTVWVGSENRNHFLGHIGLLGLRERITPFSDAGPPVAYFGSPLTASLAEWADACRRQGGVTIGVHFPIPNGETAADVVLGKLDAAEIRYDRGFASLGVTEYYRYLNCGFRLAAAGGTDKMFPTRAVGAVRTYARLQRGEPFSFEAWGRAVRAGRTFVTTGPLLFLRVEGAEPGEEIDVRGRGELEVGADVDSVFPVGDVEIVQGGRVVASGTAPLRAKVKVEGPGWIAARCAAPEKLSFGMRNIGAHTSPVYLVAEGRQPFSSRSAEYLLRLIEGGILWVDTLAVERSRAELDRVRGVFTEAQAVLKTKLDHHRHPTGVKG